MDIQEIKDEVWLIIDSLNPDEKHDDNIAKKINVLWEVIDRMDESKDKQDEVKDKNINKINEKKLKVENNGKS